MATEELKQDEMTEDEEELNPMIETAMTVIMAAGDARDHAFKALDFAENGDFEQAEACMKEAHDCIAQAHNGQTEVIQSEMRGEKHEICLLFIHAQDTLMTIMTEINLTERLIKMYKHIYNGGSKE